MTVRLRPLRVEDQEQALAAHDELAAEGFSFLLDWRPDLPWAGYVAQTAAWRCGRELPPDRVPSNFLIAELDGALAGRVSVRHEFNDFLAAYGGHIGYCVRPRFRRRGVATEILGQALIVARAHGVDRVLVTCDEDNLTSAGVIERQGGVLEDRRVDPRGVLKRRYWIA